MCTLTGALILVMLIVSMRPTGRTRHAIVALTQVQLNNLATASKTFHTTLNRWPTNLAELQTNESKMIFFDGRFADAWARPFNYVPPSSNAPGRIETFGADGNPNGDKSDGDASIELP